MRVAFDVRQLGPRLPGQEAAAGNAQDCSRCRPRCVPFSSVYGQQLLSKQGPLGGHSVSQRFHKTGEVGAVLGKLSHVLREVGETRRKQTLRAGF